MNTFLTTIFETDIIKFCERWSICEFLLFGSVLRDDFGPDSDVDILVSFKAETDWGLLDHIRMKQELKSLFHRNVDLITKRSLEQSSNWLLRREILKTVRVLFSEGETTYAAR